MCPNNTDSEAFLSCFFGMLEKFGFVYPGVAKVEAIPQQFADTFENWLAAGKHSTLNFLKSEEYKRTYLDPKQKYPFAKSIIAAAFPYNSLKNNSETVKIQGGYKISRYAHNQDYHKVLPDKLEILMKKIRTSYPKNNFAFQVDVGALPEVYWAERASVGKRGKNGLLYVPEFGSWVFIALIITDFECTSDIYKKFEETNKVWMQCKDCEKCLKACPTGAIYEPYKLDVSKCISYLTIEHKAKLSDETDLHGWFFGCDVCQQVCPMNKDAKISEDENFVACDYLRDFDAKSLEAMTKTQFNQIFANSPLKRTGIARLLRNYQKLRCN